VQQLPLDGLPAALLADLATLDLLVASSEDLVAVAAEPAAQLAAVRDAVGSHPALVVTDGERGAWLDAASGRATGQWHVPVPRFVDNVSSVGAGDAFAALILLPAWPAIADRGFLGGRAERAMRGVAEMLEGRR
jgi:sugar/nucleoside kinase (ribokinase family)